MPIEKDKKNLTPTKKETSEKNLLKEKIKTQCPAGSDEKIIEDIFLEELGRKDEK